MVGEPTKKQLLRPRAERTEAHAEQPECENTHTHKRTSSSVTHTHTHAAPHTLNISQFKRPNFMKSSGEKPQANVAVVGL